MPRRTQEPALVAAEPWSIKERLTLEKAALGFYLSGHLFDQSAEPRCGSFAKRRIADLVDSREPQLLAGIVGDLRVVNGQRGRVAIFKLDDKSERDRGGGQRGRCSRRATRAAARGRAASSCRAGCSPTASPAACA